MLIPKFTTVLYKFTISKDQNAMQKLLKKNWDATYYVILLNKQLLFKKVELKLK